jgi:hypothetical protein
MARILFKRSSKCFPLPMNMNESHVASMPSSAFAVLETGLSGLFPAPPSSAPSALKWNSWFLLDFDSHVCDKEAQGSRSLWLPSEVAMKAQPCVPTPAFPFPWLAGTALALAIIACTAYVNLTFTMVDKVTCRLSPPFQPNVNGSRNSNLGAEYPNIGKAIFQGQGFADPSAEETRPTAWMPPLLPIFPAGPFWLGGGQLTFATVVVVILQVCVLVGSGLLVLALTRAMAGRLGIWLTGGVYVIAVTLQICLSFQFTHDYWLIILVIDILIAWSCWGQALGSWKTVTALGLFGGVCVLVNPILGLAWLALPTVGHRTTAFMEATCL